MQLNQVYAPSDYFDFNLINNLFEYVRNYKILPINMRQIQWLDLSVDIFL